MSRSVLLHKSFPHLLTYFKYPPKHVGIVNRLQESLPHSLGGRRDPKLGRFPDTPGESGWGPTRISLPDRVLRPHTEVTFMSRTVRRGPLQASRHGPVGPEDTLKDGSGPGSGTCYRSRALSLLVFLFPFYFHPLTRLLLLNVHP